MRGHMTPVATIREAASQSHYAVTCDACQGRMLVDGVLCDKCRGDGRVLIPEAMPRPLLRTIFDWLKSKFHQGGN